MTFQKDDTFVTFRGKIGRRYKPTDPDYVAPDGGWGWVVVFACGFSNLAIYSMLQQFGLVFTDRFKELGITHTQTTTIVNINLALTSCVGLFNGPIYRRFSFRQVGLFGSSMVVCSLLIINFCNSFWTYFVFYGLLFGSSIGLTLSANALALNTYFKEKRSVATGFSWGVTGIGPIVWPYVITILMSYYGTDGTLLLFAGFTGHAFLCALLLQPAQWHTKFREETEFPLMPIHPINTILNGSDENKNELTITMQSAEPQVIDDYLNNNQNEYNKSAPQLPNNESFKYDKIPPNATTGKATNDKIDTGLFRQLVSFFDLDILKDLVYLNIIIGMISLSFVEWNCTILTPAILKDFNFEKYETATFMSLLAVTDVTVRFCIPFVARKLQWNNRVFYLLGAIITTTGRIILIHTQQFYISLFLAVLIGFGRGLCIVYLAMLIPGHVSLKKLPAALGIYLAFFGLFSILMAPIVGWIRDTSHSYVTTMHVLHILVYVAAIAWISEYLINKHRLKTKINEVSK